MNLKQAFASFGLIAGLAFAMSTPAQAANLTPADLGLPALSPSQPVTDGQSAPLARLPYVTRTFSPSKNLKVRFSLITPTELGSRGMGLSSFGYTNGTPNSFKSIFEETRAYDITGVANKNRPATDDWLGTCGTTSRNAITSCANTVTFYAGQTYQLALQSLAVSTYGLGSLNEYTFNAVSDQFSLGRQKITVAENGALFIGMEDGEFKKAGTKNYWYDYQDWVVKAEAVPEPATLAGLGVFAGSLTLVRRRKSAASA
ncbi:MAG: hypothetical protein Kow00121_41050 [Elainellaceae cyanobacterium]